MSAHEHYFSKPAPTWGYVSVARPLFSRSGLWGLLADLPRPVKRRLRWLFDAMSCSCERCMTNDQGGIWHWLAKGK